MMIETEAGADVRRPLFRLAAEHDWTILALEPVGADLESVFISLTAKDTRDKGER